MGAFVLSFQLVKLPKGTSEKAKPLSSKAASKKKSFLQKSLTLVLLNFIHFSASTGFKSRLNGFSSFVWDFIHFDFIVLHLCLDLSRFYVYGMQYFILYFVILLL